MCGIIAVVRRPSERAVPSAGEIEDLLAETAALLTEVLDGPVDAGLLPTVAAAAARAAAADRLLASLPGLRAMIASARLRTAVESLSHDLDGKVRAFERQLDEGSVAGRDLESLNAALIELKDAVWGLRRDRLRAAVEVEALAGPGAGPAALAVHLSVHQALSAIDRLEVRGRDSAGLHLLVRDHGLDLHAPAIRAALAERAADPLFSSMAVRTPEGHLSFVYKAAAEIGELGDNTRHLRAAITADALLHQALGNDAAQAVVLGHTRWASVGIVSEPNAHPLNSDQLDGARGAYVTAVLNGDVDNFADLKVTDGLSIAPEITTDAKVIPTLTSRSLSEGGGTGEAFRRTVNRLEGSVAIAANVADEPADLLLALRGSGQALYIGLAEDAYVVASEPYGVVEETDTYLRLDGEVPVDPDNPASVGQVVVLRGDAAGLVEGIERQAYDATPLPVAAADLAVAEITTRDIDRGDAPHYLLKEIGEAPASFRKTLRGKLVDGPDGPTVTLGPDVVPPAVRDGLRDGSLTRLLVIGQGTAAVAGRSLVEAMAALAPGTAVRTEAVLATELSGFDLRDDMSDTLVVAVSQSGTTTDTNRTVDLVRARGARVIAVVNRRGSDLTDRADGVLYTSDGRDVEMSVASTKAFYAQIAACHLLAVDLAAVLAGSDPATAAARAEVLDGLRALPEAMEQVMALRPEIARAAHDLAPSRRYWAVVGNGVNRIAAEEVRIKLSELCYKAIACDGTEDKKHIDLSSEPLILVCAAGLQGSNVDDVAKEVAIYRAHKAAPVVVATEGEARFSAALHVIAVPVVHPRLAFVLSAMVGHLFGYEAALAVDAQARPLREARAAIDEAAAAGRSGEAALRELREPFAAAAARFFDGLRAGSYDGHLEASTAVRLASTWRFALEMVPLEAYQVEHGKVGTPGVVLEDLAIALSRAIDELTRPIDAIKHQAKTVTVGISRSDETLLQVPLVREVLAAGAARDRLTYSTLRTLSALGPMVAEVRGYTRYAIEGRVEVGDVADEATVVVVDRGGIGRDLRSRTEHDPRLRGTKRWVAVERTVLVARGRSDGRTVIIVPEVKDGQPTGLALLHVDLRDDLSLPALRAVLLGYRNRYAAIKNAVTETEPVFRDDLLTTVDVVDLMTEPVNDLADRWRS
jgi:glucosamine--fructose-6-phosphate aminotransferase (isomerizing)